MTIFIIVVGVGAAILALGVIVSPIIYGKIKQDNLAKKIVGYSENSA